MVCVAVTCVNGVRGQGYCSIDWADGAITVSKPAGLGKYRSASRVNAGRRPCQVELGQFVHSRNYTYASVPVTGDT